MKTMRWLSYLMLPLLLATQVSALSGFTITNNTELMKNPYAYWSTTVFFHDELKAVSTNLVRFGWKKYFQVTGRETTFYVPQDLSVSLDRLTPGDRMAVNAMIQSEQQGLIVVALRLEVSTHTVDASADENGTITPAGAVRVERGANAEFVMAAKDRCSLARVRVDGEELEGVEGRKQFSYAFENVTRSHTIEASFERQRFALTVESAFGKVDPPAGVARVEDGREMTASVAADSVRGAKPGVRYALAGWEGTGAVPAKGTGSVARFQMTQDSTLKWKWNAEYELTVKAEAGGSVGARPAWHAAGAGVTLDAAPADGFRFAGWKGDVAAEAAKANPVTVVMDRPRALTALFEKDVIAITASAGRDGSIEPKGVIEVARGRAVEFSIRAQEHFHIDEVLVDGKGLGDIDGEKSEYAYRFDEVTAPHSIEARFAPDQYELIVESSRGAATPAAGAHIYEHGAVVEARGSAAPVVSEQNERMRFVVTGWKGRGAVPEKGAGTVVQFTMTQDSELEWEWAAQYLFEGAASEGGAVDQKTGWYLAGSEVSLEAKPAPISRFVGWSGELPAEKKLENPLVLKVDKPRKVTAVFERDTVALSAKAGKNGTIEPAGEVKIDRGADAIFHVEAQDHFHIAEILVDGLAVDDLGVNQGAYEYTFEGVQGPHTLSASFARNRYALTLASDVGVVKPAAGSYEYEYGQAVEARVEKTMVQSADPGSRFVLRGWRGSGDAPLQGTGSVVRFAMTQDTTLDWEWQTQHELKTRAGEGGRVEGLPGWYVKGAAVRLTAIAEEGSKFEGWSGDVPEARRRDNPVTIVMDQRRLIAADFHQDLVALTAVAGENGGMTPKGETTVRRGAKAEFAIQADAHYHINKVLVDGEPVGDLAEEQDAYTYTFGKVTAPHRIEAFFARNRYGLTIRSERGLSAPATGVHRHEQGESVTVEMKETLVSGAEPGVRYVLAGWSGTGDVPAGGTGTVVRFQIHRDSSLTWVWRRENELALSVVGDGAVVGRPGWYPADAVVALGAEARDRSHFENWMGDLPQGRGRLNPVEVVMDRPRTIKAVFAREQGELGIVVNPDSGVWKFLAMPPDFAGPVCGTGSVAQMKVPAGAYLLEYQAIPHYREPESQSVTLAPKARYVFSGTYAPVPELSVSVSRLEQSILDGQGAASQTFEVWNSGHGTLKYAISRNVGWLWLSPKIGTSTGEHDVIRVDYNTADMAPDTYTGTLTVAVRDAEVIPHEVLAVLKVKSSLEPVEVETKAPAAPVRSGLAEGLLAYYPFDGNTMDYSGMNNAGLVRGALAYAGHEPFGQAGTFNQRGKVYVEVPSQDYLVLTNSFTIQLWYKSGAASGRILQKLWPAQRSDRREWEISIRDDARMLFKYAVPGTTDNFEFLCPLDSQWANGTWNQFVYAYSGESNRLYGYLNGVAATNQAPKYRMMPLDTPLPLMMMHDRYKSTTGARFDAEGFLDEVAIWSRRLSDEEIRALYQTPLSRQLNPDAGKQAGGAAR